AVAGHMRTSLVTAAPGMALAARKPAAGVIFHSDRGCQYTSSVFDSYCKENDIRRSLGRTGICYDNAVSESFFATCKKELIHTRPWPTLAALEGSVPSKKKKPPPPPPRGPATARLREGDPRLDHRLLQYDPQAFDTRVLGVLFKTLSDDLERTVSKTRINRVIRP